MERLIPDDDKEMDAIAIRFIVIKMEHPNYDIRGMLENLKCKINRHCIEIGEIGGENGTLWN